LEGWHWASPVLKKKIQKQTANGMKQRDSYTEQIQKNAGNLSIHRIQILDPEKYLAFQ